MQDVVIVGCGDIGSRVGQKLLARGQQVLATARSEERSEELRALGFSTLIGNFDFQDETHGIPLHGREVFYFMPPQGGGKSDYRMLNFCRQLSPDNCPAKLLYISTSGVYGDCGGAVVTEETPVNPQTTRALRRVNAEEQLREQADKLGFELAILRVTGIYGPGRLPVSRIMQGHPVLRPEDASFTNRIHSFDLVQVCLAAMEKASPGDVYNVCDGQESSMTDYFLAVADLYGLPRPEQISLAEAEQVMNPLMLSYQKESRRMTNQKMREQLGVELEFPTLAEGLEVCREEQ